MYGVGVFPRAATGLIYKVFGNSGVGFCFPRGCNTLNSKGGSSSHTLRSTVSRTRGGNNKAIILRDKGACCSDSIVVGGGIRLRLRGNSILGTASSVGKCFHPYSFVGSRAGALVNGPIANGPSFTFVCTCGTSGTTVAKNKGVSTGNRDFMGEGSGCCIANSFCPHPAIVCFRTYGRVIFRSFAIISTPF